MTEIVTIVTDGDFQNAVSWLVDNGLLPVIGERVISKRERKVWDRDRLTFQVIDITPDLPTLENALTQMLIRITEENNQESAREVGLQKAKQYLAKRLADPNPDLNAIFTTVKGHVDSNATLQQMVTNQIAFTRGALAWPVLDLATAQGKQRYLFCVQMVIATL